MARGNFRDRVDWADLNAFLQPREHRVCTENPIREGPLRRVRDAEIALSDKTSCPFYRPSKQQVWLLLTNPPPDIFDALFHRNGAVEWNHKQPPLHAAIHAALKGRQVVGRKKILRNRPKLDAALIHVASFNRLSGHD